MTLNFLFYLNREAYMVREMTATVERANIFQGGTKLDDLASMANAAHAACEQNVRSALV